MAGRGGSADAYCFAVVMILKYKVLHCQSTHSSSIKVVPIQSFESFDIGMKEVFQFVCVASWHMKCQIVLSDVVMVTTGVLVTNYHT